MKITQNRLIPVVLCSCVMLLLLACQVSNAVVTPTSTSTQVSSPPTIFPTPTVTPYPLGSLENPYILAVVAAPEKINTVEQAQEEIADYLTAETNAVFSSVVYMDYQKLLVDLEKKKVHFAWLPPVTYLAAKQNSSARPVLLVNTYGVYFYGVQFFAAVESGFNAYFDSATGNSTAPTNTALSQFANKIPCWVDPTSISGYVVPLGLLEDQVIELGTGVFSQNPTAVIRSLYIQGVCDFGVTYAHIGDPRTSSSLSDLPDLMERIIIIWKSDPIIPTINLSAYPDIDPRLVQQVAEKLAVLMQTQVGKQWLSQALDTAAEGVKPIDDASYEPLRHYLNVSRVNIQQLIGK